MKKLAIIIALVFFIGTAGAMPAFAEEKPEQEKTKTVVSTISGTSEDIETQIEMWQEYIDKYIMPNALAVLTSISMIFAVFAKFKGLLELYKENKAEFDEEKENVFAQLKGDVSAIMETLKEVGAKTTESIENMPIESMQSDLSNAKVALEAEMKSIQDFTKLFEIFLSSERKLVETSYLSPQDKQEMRKLLYEGEQIAKRNQSSLADVSDFVIGAIGNKKSDDVAILQDTFTDVNIVESIGENADSKEETLVKMAVV